MWWVVWTVAVVATIWLYNRATAGRCWADTVMTGKVAVVTGASGGVGYETARELAARGARVVLACRNRARGRRAAERIADETGNRDVRCCHLDLASLASVRRFVDELKSSEAKLDVLINNAGALRPRRRRTEDGLMEDMQINHFGPFLLTVLLVPLLKASESSRVVIVSSSWHRYGSLADLDSAARGYVRAYADGKLCNVVFGRELARRLAGSGVAVGSAGPGLVDAARCRHAGPLERARGLLLRPFLKSAREGAQTPLHLALSADCDQASGGYFEECREARAAPAAADPALGARLWALSAALVRLSPEEDVPAS